MASPHRASGVQPHASVNLYEDDEGNDKSIPSAVDGAGEADGDAVAALVPCTQLTLSILAVESLVNKEEFGLQVKYAPHALPLRCCLSIVSLV